MGSYYNEGHYDSPFYPSVKSHFVSDPLRSGFIIIGLMILF